MARYYTGQVPLPAGGGAVPVCRVGPHGCLVIDPSGAGGGTFVGGPDVTTATGFPLAVNVPTFIPGAMGFGAPVAPADPSHPAPVLYACSAAADTLTWLSMLPPAPGDEG
jgi:hypothetical protein